MALVGKARVVGGCAGDVAGGGLASGKLGTAVEIHASNGSQWAA